MQMGRLALHKGEGEGEGSLRLTGVNFETPHLNPLPFRKGRGERRKSQLA
jgi:hypothetical protein